MGRSSSPRRDDRRGGRRSTERDRDRGRRSGRDRRSRSRDRDRGRHRRGGGEGRSRERDRGGRDRDRRRRGRSPSSDSSSGGNYFANHAGGNRHFLRGQSKPAGPTKTWNGFQWVTQTADAPQGALTASGEVRKLRRLHVGNLPANVASEGGDELLSAAIWNELKARAMPLTGGFDTNPILSVWLSQADAGGTRFSFVEFTSPEDASTAMALDGMNYLGNPLRFSRPNDYKEPQQANGVGSLALLQHHAQLAMAAQAQAAAAAAAAAPVSTPPATEVLVLSNLTTAETTDDELSDILEDVTEEAKHSGAVVSATIVRSGTLAPTVSVRPGSVVGDVWLLFESKDGAEKCYGELHGRIFAGNMVKGAFAPKEQYAKVVS